MENFSHFRLMDIKQCPVLHPTLEQFNNFYEYIHTIDDQYKNDFGMVKVVPPSQWKPQSTNYDHILQNLKVKNAIEQIAQGRGGYYQSKNVVQKEMAYKAYKRYSEKQSLSVKGKTSEEKQKLFWKTIMYSSPIYGSDLTGSLMDETAGAWNMNHLDSLLKYAMPYRVKGVTQPYCYIGTWKAFFSWHKQDLDLSAINYIHEGQPKIWYSIAPQDSHLLQKCAQKHYRLQYIQCSQFLRHKTFLIKPQALLKEYPDIKLSRTTHHAGEIMLVFGGAYHEGFNCGFNIAEAVNYATFDWLNQILEARSCACSRKSVKASVQSILYNLQESQIFEQLLQLQSFQKIRNFIQRKQAEQAGNQTLIESIHLCEQLFNENVQNVVQEYKQKDNVNIQTNNKIESSKEKVHKMKTKPIKKKQKQSIKHNELPQVIKQTVDNNQIVDQT